MKVDVLNMKGEVVDTTDLPADIFEQPLKVDLMHQAFTRQMANARAGTHATKDRSQVRGGGSKPWRQKGTGRARHGSIRSPLWVGGGKVHTPKPRDYSQKMPKKMRRAALRAALSAKAAEGEIVVLDELVMDEIKTKKMAAELQGLVGDDSALILLAAADEKVEKSVRNLTSAMTLRAEYLNIRDLLSHKRLLMPLAALEVISGHLAN
jgi:large subunit ribosomal protein L4